MIIYVMSQFLKESLYFDIQNYITHLIDQIIVNTNLNCDIAKYRKNIMNYRRNYDSIAKCFMATAFL